ncbi:polyadenylate-binding protein-interacting protein 7-like [Aristolochia californica]|uniref:polyadenylate-binding protein-interacting protein 7-like n=1 Tax=Aristolochia californica TaxID=171875 RepID=UPI0035E1389C
MNLSSKGFPVNKDSKLNTPGKVTKLNPNAAEFVPSALRSTAIPPSYNTNPTRLDVTGTSGKPVFDRSESSISNNSDDEAHQYWRHQLPDDITPDFKVMREEELQGPGSLSLVGLSLNDGVEISRFSPSGSGSHLLSKCQELTSEDINLGEKLRYSGPTFVEDSSVGTMMNMPTSLWDKRFINGGQDITNGRGEGHPYNGDLSANFMNELLSENVILDGNDINPLEFLASQFPGFAAESLADVYYANGCDLNLTIEMLTQLELQSDSDFSQNLNSKTLSAPNLSTLDFPALPASDAQAGVPKYAGDGLQQAANPFRSVDKDNLLLFKSSNSSGTNSRAIDFASAVRKLAAQDSGQWKCERNGVTDASVGTSRNPQVLASSYTGHPRSPYGGGDRLQNYGGSRAAPLWLETGEAVANMYSELRDEARDHARLRNACFEQARQAYLIGNKALAKELSVKGQLHNMQMKAAHGKARESIYRQRNPVSPELQSFARGQEPIIDLHGLHVSEAIHMLKHELSVLRSTARSAGQRLQVLICVGTGHHTKGTRTPARLPMAIERYLLEEEGLDYTEPQPGLLRVVIY